MPGRDLRQARRLAERLRSKIEAAAMAHPDSPVASHVTISIGVSVIRPDADTASE